ncbi:MAG: hypothetical protein ACRECE_07880 [Xanthobacteraceae bacterium]
MRRGSRRRRGSPRRTARHELFEALHLLLELLVMVLELLDLPGQIANGLLHPIDPIFQIGIRILILCVGRLYAKRA